MSDQDKTKEQLLEETRSLRESLAAAVRDSENRFQAFMDNSPSVAFMKDEEGRYVYVSRNFRRFVGRDPEQMIGKTDDEVWPPETARLVREHDAAVLAAGKVFEMIETGPAANGEQRHFIVFKFPFRDGSGKLFLGGVARDVTESKRAEVQLTQYADRLQSLSHRLVQVQEEERRRLARELHDEIGQALTSLRFTLETVADAAGGVPEGPMDEARALIEETLARLRNLSFDLRPALLDHLGLLPALHQLVERYTARTKVRVNLKHAGLERRLPPEVETAAYRLVQEALTNVARHAGVAEAAVRLWVAADDLEIQIEDMGLGFHPEAVLAAGQSCGLPGMLERARLLGGRLTIESTVGGGTNILAVLPLAGLTERKIDEHFHRLGR
jgi:PAS domain S-box-containing protein